MRQSLNKQTELFSNAMYRFRLFINHYMSQYILIMNASWTHGFNYPLVTLYKSGRRQQIQF